MSKVLKESIVKLNHIIKNMKEDTEINAKEISDIITKIWEHIDDLRGKISDLIVSKLSENLTKLTVAIDAFISGMISYSNLRGYVLKEELHEKIAYIIKKYLE
ncbi:MAG: hypothetical protein ACTSSJ_02360 [Candidatus Odinarchaeia archaeon]